MNLVTQPALQHLFQVSALEDIPRQRLEEFVAEYPCFGYGHYLLSRKLRAEDSGGFLTATQKTSLYFSNPFWLQWLLDNAPEARATGNPSPVADEEPVTTEALVTEPAETAPVTVESPLQDPEPLVEAIAADYAAVPEPVLSAEQLEVTGEEEGIILDPAAAGEQPAPAGEQTAPAEEQLAPAGEQPAPAGDPDHDLSAAELLLDSLQKARELRESLLRINEDYLSNTGHPIPSTTTAEEPVPLSEQQPLRDEEPPFVLGETPPAEPAPAQMDPAPEAAPTRAEPAPEPQIHAPAATAEPVAQAEAMPVFEPLHTIDYFASQGIRLTLDEHPADALGRQLKSFTEWLKTMRRLPQKDREIIPDRVAEQTVQTFAAHSIEGKEVVTETMAEVLIKQGMRERARLVYEKLSLLNPGKSAYFAAKIEQLNSP